MSTIFHDIQQNTEAWFDLRAGKITSSGVAKVMAHFGKPFGDPAKAYAVNVALERVTGKRVESNNYVSFAMQKGTELEPIARDLYSFDKIMTVSNGGFFENGKMGDSPDGVVKDGVIEIKCVEPVAHMKRLKMGGIDPAYKHQITFHILMTGAKFCDFVSYCEDFPEDKQLYVFRVMRNEEDLENMRERIGQFEKVIEDNIKLLKQ